MSEWSTLCPGCMEDKGAATRCPRCDYDERARRSGRALSPRTLLNGQYLVGRTLGRAGGFGITYLGWDTRLLRRVAIKEFIPHELADRDSHGMDVVVSGGDPTQRDVFAYGLENFLNEARFIAQLDHPGIVGVIVFFEENATAYLVMPYYSGLTLGEYIERQKGPLPPSRVADFIVPVLDGLELVHAQGLLHRDIKPDNIYLVEQSGDQYRPILIDFGAARMAIGARSENISVLLTEGFAPFEQYYSHGDQGPWTDIYACAATCYYMLTGQAPPDAIRRSQSDELVPPRTLIPAIPEPLSTALVQGLEFEAAKRPQTVGEFRRLLEGGDAPPPPPPFEVSRFVIGRSRDADVVIADESVSRHHAELRVLENGKLMLEDLDSTNGTVLVRDGQTRKIQEAEIFARDLVRFGEAEIGVEDLLAALPRQQAAPVEDEQEEANDGDEERDLDESADDADRDTARADSQPNLFLIGFLVLLGVALLLWMYSQ